MKTKKMSKRFGWLWFKKKRDPSVVMTLLVRDEADIILENIEYHLNAGVDFIVAIDNRSVDETGNILHKFERAGKLRYIFENSDNYLQDLWVTNLAQIAANEYGADWVINNDADEFFIPSYGTIKDVLGAVSPDVGAISVKRYDFVPLERMGKHSPPVEMIYRKNVSLEWVLGHPIVDKVIHRGYHDVQITRGSHSVQSRFIKKQVPISNMVTFHYPIRSYEQFEKKVRNIGFGRKQHRLPRTRYDYWYSSWEKGDLKNVYRGYCLNDAQLRDGLEAGEIIEDRQLSEYFGNMG
jgi:hypothetical protein